jgi:hypothetical protein
MVSVYVDGSVGRDRGFCVNTSMRQYSHAYTGVLDQIWTTERTKWPWPLSLISHIPPRIPRRVPKEAVSSRSVSRSSGLPLPLDSPHSLRCLRHGPSNGIAHGAFLARQLVQPAQPEVPPLQAHACRSLVQRALVSREAKLSDLAAW